MNASAPDLARLHATLGDPRLARLLALLRRRLEQGAPLAGNATLGTATSAERAAIDELFGRRPSRGATLAVDLDALAAHLHAAGICDDLSSGVQQLLGPIDNRRAARETHVQAWAAVRLAAEEIGANHPRLKTWLGDLVASGVLKRLAQDEPACARSLLDQLATLVRALPADAEPLPAFAARLCGDAHALDPGTPFATLAVRAAAQLGALAEFEDKAEFRRAAWASVGAMCDELSTPALVLNLPAAADTPLARLIRCARNAGETSEPLHLSLRLLLRYPLSSDPALRDCEVFVCENPTIVALAAARIGRACAPLVCANGQFATPALVLLRQLRAAGARLRYHGDFDPAGLAIVRRVVAACGAAPWRMNAADYLAAPKGIQFEGDPGPTPWSPELAEAMRRERRAVHEEAVFGALAEDLARR